MVKGLYKKVHDDQILSKIVAGVIVGILLVPIVSLIWYAVHRWVPGGWDAVFGVAEDAAGWAWGALLAMLTFGIPAWCVLVGGVGVIAVFWRVAHASESYQQAAIDLRKELREVLEEQALERMEGPPLIEELVVQGIRWRCTHAANGTVDSLKAFCPTCDNQIDTHQRFPLHGSPVAYSCTRCHKVITKFDDTRSIVERQVGHEIERLERQEHMRFRGLVKDKVEAGLDAATAGQAAINQILNDRQQRLEAGGRRV